MKAYISLLVIAVAVGGCANERIIAQSSKYSENISALPIREVINNFDKTVENPFFIPARTTYGSGQLTFTDNNQITITQPFHNIARSSSSLGLDAGQFIDQYTLSVQPETNANNLLILRNIYHDAVYHDEFGSRRSNQKRSPRWLFWNNIDGTPSPHPALVEAMQYIGTGNRHEFYVSDPKAFSDFILKSFGADLDVKSPAIAAKRSLRKAPSTPSANVPKDTESRPRNSTGLTERAKPKDLFILQNGPVLNLSK